MQTPPKGSVHYVLTHRVHFLVNSHTVARSKVSQPKPNDCRNFGLTTTITSNRHGPVSSAQEVPKGGTPIRAELDNVRTSCRIYKVT